MPGHETLLVSLDEGVPLGAAEAGPILRAIGRKRGLPMIPSGEPVGAREALELGIGAFFARRPAAVKGR